MRRKRIFAAVLAGAMLFSAGCGKEETVEEEAAPAGTAVEVMEVQAGEMSAEYAVTGKVAAVNEVQVFPLLAGQVMTLPVKEGDKVSKGQTLFTVDLDDGRAAAVLQRYQDRDRPGDRIRADRRGTGAEDGG